MMMTVMNVRRRRVCMRWVVSWMMSQMTASWESSRYVCSQCWRHQHTNLVRRTDLQPPQPLNTTSHLAAIPTCIPPPTEHFIIPWPRVLDLWPLYFRVSACRGPAKFDTDSLSRFSFRERTYSDTQSQKRLITLSPTWVTSLIISWHVIIYCTHYKTRSIWKMLGPFATASRRTPMSTTTTTTTTTTRDIGDRYGPIEWAQ